MVGTPIVVRLEEEELEKLDDEMHETLATIMTSRRVSRAWVALWRRRSIRSLIIASFSMKRSCAGR